MCAETEDDMNAWMAVIAKVSGKDKEEGSTPESIRLFVIPCVQRKLFMIKMTCVISLMRIWSVC